MLDPHGRQFGIETPVGRGKVQFGGSQLLCGGAGAGLLHPVEGLSLVALVQEIENQPVEKIDLVCGKGGTRCVRRESPLHVGFCRLIAK